jgi:indolepyruvate ferredoxin oxidoreductase
MVEKLDAVRAFARANPIDRRVYDIPDARFGIIATGKGYLDLMEALRLLGIDEARAREIGIDIYKVGMVWPLETRGARDFLRGKEEVLGAASSRVNSRRTSTTTRPTSPAGWWASTTRRAIR